MDSQRLSEIVSKFPSKRIAVIGDFFLDKYLEFDPELAEISLETNKVANQVVNIRHSPGAAGNVVSNLAALGAENIQAVGFTGDDGEGYELRKDLTNIGCCTTHLIYAPNRYTPIYLKPQNSRVKGLAGEESRYDTKNRNILPKDIQQQIAESLNAVKDSIDALIVIDQADEENCGVITDFIRDAIIKLGEESPDTIIWTDSRMRAGYFRNTILKPNQSEALKAAFNSYDGSINDEIVHRAGNLLSKRNNKPVFLTRGEHGITIFHDGLYEHAPGFKVNGETDPTGAGDSVTAAAVLSLVSGASLIESAFIANLAAHITVQKIGVTGTASPSELADALNPLKL